MSQWIAVIVRIWVHTSNKFLLHFSSISSIGTVFISTQRLSHFLMFLSLVFAQCLKAVILARIYNRCSFPSSQRTCTQRSKHCLTNDVPTPFVCKSLGTASFHTPSQNQQKTLNQRTDFKRNIENLNLSLINILFVKIAKYICPPYSSLRLPLSLCALRRPREALLAT